MAEPLDPPGVVTIDRSTTTAVLATWLESIGLPPRPARVVSSHVVDAELVGRRSHGLRLVPALARGIMASTDLAADVAVRETEPGACVIDASASPGIFALHRATEELISGHARGRRVMSAGVVGFRWTTGCLGLFAHRLAEAGYTALVQVTSPSIMAPPGSARPLLGTNAISFGAPTLDGAPVVGDFASSEWSYGDVALARERGEAVPLGVLLDSRGEPTTDPAAVLDGSLVPSGGHRGWVQALLVEVLAGALVGGKVGRGPGRESALVLSFRPDAFAATGAPGAVGDLVAQICSPENLPGRETRHVPGARFERLRGSAQTLGVDVATLRRIEEMGGPTLG